MTDQASIAGGQPVVPVSRLLDGAPELRHLRLDCSEMTFCDSAGLSGLLQIHRRTSGAGVQLHLDDRPPHLERLRQSTGTLDHLIAACDGEADTDDAEPTGISDGGELAGSRGDRNA